MRSGTTPGTVLRIASVVGLSLLAASCAAALFDPTGAIEYNLTRNLTLEASIHAATTESFSSTVYSASAYPDDMLGVAYRHLLFFNDVTSYSLFAARPGSSAYLANSLSNDYFPYGDQRYDSYEAAPIAVSSPPADTGYLGYVSLGSSDPGFVTYSVTFGSAASNTSSVATNASTTYLTTTLTTYVMGPIGVTLDRVVGVDVESVLSGGQAVFVLALDQSGNYWSVEIPVDPTTGALSTTLTLLSDASLMLSLPSTPSNGFYRYDTANARNYFSYFDGVKVRTVAWKAAVVDPTDPTKVQVKDLGISLPIRRVLPDGNLFARLGDDAGVYKPDGTLVNSFTIGGLRLVETRPDGASYDAVFSQVFFASQGKGSGEDIYIRFYSTPGANLFTMGH